MVFFPFLYTNLLNWYSLEQTLMLNGAILLHMVPISLLLPKKLRRSDEDNKNDDKKGTEASCGGYAPLKQNPVYICILVCCFFMDGSATCLWGFVYLLMVSITNFSQT